MLASLENLENWKKGKFQSQINVIKCNRCNNVLMSVNFWGSLKPWMNGKWQWKIFKYLTNLVTEGSPAWSIIQRNNIIFEFRVKTFFYFSNFFYIADSRVFLHWVMAAVNPPTDALVAEIAEIRAPNLSLRVSKNESPLIMQFFIMFTRVIAKQSRYLRNGIPGKYLLKATFEPLTFLYLSFSVRLTFISASNSCSICSFSVPERTINL